MAQHRPQDLDSLNNLLNQKLHDTIRANVFHRIFHYYYIKDPKKASEYNQKIFELSTKISYEAGLIDYYDNQGLLFYNESKFKEAEEYFRKALKLIGNKTIRKKVIVIHHLGAIAHMQENHAKAIDLYLQALKICETNNYDEYVYISITQSLGALYLQQEDYTQAIFYLEKTIETAKKVNYITGGLYAYNGLGVVYYGKKDYDKAMDYFGKCLQIAEGINDTRIKSSASSYIGKIYLSKKSPDSTIKYSKLSIECLKKLNDSLGLADVSLVLAKAHTEKKEYDIAFQLTEEALTTAKKFNNLASTKTAYNTLADIYKKKRQFEEALQYFEKAQELEDTLYNTEKHKQILQIQNQYDNYKREQKLSEKEFEINDLKKERKIGFLSLSLLFLALFSTILFGYLFIKQKQLKAKKDKALLELEQAMLKEEQMQTQLELINTRQQLENKDKELTSFTLNMIQKNELLNELKQQVEDLISKAEDKAVVQPLQRLKQNILSNDQSDKQWENFRIAFEQVHKNFFHNLQQQYPDITPYDMKLSALLRLNFSSKEIASFLGISEDSVKKARYRLRKKLNMEQDENLVTFLMKIEET
jgi:pentatricopeptide repeat protein